MSAGPVASGPVAPVSATVVFAAAAGLVIAFGHMTRTHAVEITSLAGALGTLCSVSAAALARKPVSLHLVTGAAAVIVADLALFGVHWDYYQRGAVVTFIGVITALVLHMLNITVMAKPYDGHRGAHQRPRGDDLLQAQGPGSSPSPNVGDKGETAGAQSVSSATAPGAPIYSLRGPLCRTTQSVTTWPLCAVLGCMPGKS